MNRFAWAALAITLGAGAASAQTAIKHRFLAVDNGGNKLLLVDQITNKGWSVAIPGGSRDLQLLDGNKVLVSHGDGAAEYDLTNGAKGWSVTGFSGVSTARRLPNGNTLIGTSDANAITVYEVGTDKAQKAKHTFAGLTDLRLMRVLDNGNYIFGLAGSHKVVEMTVAGGTVATINLTDKGYVALRQPNGHTLATSGEDSRVYDVDAAGKLTVVGGGLEKFPSSGLLWFSGFELLSNGHYFVANWNGHGHEGQGPHAVEFDAGNNLVWKWEDHTAAATVTNVLTFETTTSGVLKHPEGYFRSHGKVEGFRLQGGAAAYTLDAVGGSFLVSGRELPVLNANPAKIP